MLKDEIENKIKKRDRYQYMLTLHTYDLDYETWITA
jgi:hypothetical protein